MPDRMTAEQRHECMAAIHSRDTRPEQAARHELWRRGYRYRVNVRKLPGTPDIVLPKYRTVIFVNGCFWHGHKGCRNYTVPKTNVKFWREKVARNKERDLVNDQRLETLAWGVITVWECELTKANMSATMDRIEAALKENQAKWEAYKTRRRQDRRFAREQARRRSEITALVEAELNSIYHIPDKIRKASREEID